MARHKAWQRSVVLAVFLSGLVTLTRAQTTSHFTDADPNDSFWTTAGNWDSGVPDDQTAAYIGGGNTAAHPTGSAVAQLLTVGHAGVTLPGNGTLNMSGGTLDVAGISLAADAGYTGILNLTGGTITVTGGVTSGGGAGAVYADGGTMTINGDLLIDALRVGHEGRTAGVVVEGTDVQIGTGSGSDLIVGQRVGATSTTTGTLNLSETGGVAINVGTVSLGHNRSTPSGSPTTTGTLTLSGTGANSITADLIRLGQIDGGSTGTTTGTLNLGQNNAIDVDSFVVGSDKAVGVVKFSAGGTLTLGGRAGGAANLVIGANNSSGTGTNPAESHFNLAGGTVNAALGSVMIGQYGFGTSGTGSGKGRFTMDAGSVTANSVSLAHSVGTNPGNTTGTLIINGGSFDVTHDVIGGTGASTIQVNGGSMTVGGDLTVNSLRVGHQGRTAAVSADGDVVINGSGTGLLIGHRLDTTSQTTGTVDLSDADSVTINTGTVAVAYNAAASGGGTGVSGTLTLSAEGTNVITADLLRVGQIDGGATGTTRGTLNLGQDNTIHADTFIFGGDKAQGVINIAAGGTLSLAGKSGGAANLVIGANNSSGTGTNPTESHFNVAGGTFNAALGSVVIGQYGFGTSGAGSGKGRFTMDAGTVTADSVLLADSVGTNPGNTQGTLVINGGSFTVANDVTAGSGTSTINLAGGTLEVGGGIVNGAGTSTISVTGTPSLSVGGTLAVDSLRVAYNAAAGSLAPNAAEMAIGASDTDRGSIIVGHTTGGGLSSTGTLNLAEMPKLTAYLNEFIIGRRVNTDNTNGTARGVVTLAQENYIDAAAIVVARNEYWNTDPGSTLILGADNTFKVDTFTVAELRANAQLELPTNGVLNLSGSSGAATDLFIANNAVGTSHSGVGIMDLSKGVFNATLNNLVIGYHDYDSGSGTGTLHFAAGNVTANSVALGHAGTHATLGDGTGHGTLNMAGGSFTIDGPVTLGTGTAASTGTINVSGGTMTVAGNVTGGVGTSTVHIDGGTITVDGDLKVDALRVGHEGGTATATAKGTSVQIGNGSGMGVLIGHRLTSALSATTTGTLDLSAADEVTINTGTVAVAYTAASANSGNVSGTLTLSAAGTNAITADLVRIGHIDLGATGAVTGILNLGASNTINADTFIVGGDKSRGIVTIAAGGTLDLGGKLGGAANLLIGVNNNPTTGQNPAQSHFNLAGGTLNATLDSLIIGQYIGNPGAGGSGKGRFTMTDGTVTVSSVLLADSLGSSPANTTGTVELKGGTLRAGTISKGAGQAVFNWTGGQLSVDSFGFDLLQTSTDGTSTLAPGTSIGTTTIDGNYTMDIGTLEIEIAAPGDHDFVMVHGNATLAGNLNVLLLDDYVPALGTHFDVLQTAGDLDISGLTLTGDLPNSTFGWWNLGAVASGEGFLLRLSAVPEPSTAVLLILGVAVLLGWRRRK